MCRLSSVIIMIAIVGSLIISATLAILFYFGIVPLLLNITTLATVAAILSIVGLAAISLFAVIYSNRELSECLSYYGISILIITKLLFIALILALSFPLASFSIFSTIVLFFVLLFFLLLLTYYAALIYCFIIKSRQCASR